MAEKMEFPLQLKRQYSGSLVADEVFDNQEERMAYLSNPTRYAGQIVVQKDTGKIYVINESKDGYISTGGTASISKEEGNKIEEKDDGIYVSKEIISITKEEYDALPDDETGKLNPNIIYNVVDETGEFINIVDDIVGTNNVWSSRKVNDSLEEINANLAGLTFGQTDDGKWGYKPTGADSVIPFKSGNCCEILEISNAIKGINTIRFPRPNPIGFYYVVDSTSYPSMYYSTDMKNVLYLRKGSATYTGGRYTMPSTATEVVRSVTDRGLTIHLSNDAPNGKLYCFYDESSPSIESEGATILRDIMVGGTNNIFTTEKACKEINITFGFSKAKFVIKVNGEDKTSLFNNYGAIYNDYGMSSATISGDFPVGTEISIQNKSAGNAGYVICY